MQLYLLYLQIIPTFVPIKSNPIINKTSTAVMKKKTILLASCLLGALAFSCLLYTSGKALTMKHLESQLAQAENWTYCAENVKTKQYELCSN